MVGRAQNDGLGDLQWTALPAPTLLRSTSIHKFTARTATTRLTAIAMALIPSIAEPRRSRWRC